MPVIDTNLRSPQTIDFSPEDKKQYPFLNIVKDAYLKLRTDMIRARNYAVTVTQNVSSGTFELIIPPNTTTEQDGNWRFRGSSTKAYFEFREGGVWKPAQDWEKSSG
jgi:hypothetical protein